MSSSSDFRRTAKATASDRLPEVPHSDTGVTMASEWLLGTPERQREAAEHVVDAWRQRPWPDGLHSYALFLADDGDTLRHYSQWRDEAAFTRFQATARDERLEGVDAALPGIVRQNLDHYRVHRSFTSAEPVPASPFVVFAAGEADSSAQLGPFVGAILGEGGFLGGPPPQGVIAAHFHLNTAGTQLLTYALWTDEAAYEAAMTASGGPEDPPPLRNPTVTRLRHFATLFPEE